MVDFQELHQKYVLGEPLSAEELQQLEGWYAVHDEQETAQLVNHPIDASTDDIQIQINILFEQISQELIQIRKITQENNEIKTTNEILRSQLVQSAA